MSSESHALPRVRTRAKRRKPPRPQFWAALFCVTYLLGSVGTLVALAVLRDIPKGDAVMVGCETFGVFGVAVILHDCYWPWLRYEIELWRRDEE
jgi:hypothetical protein